jgi:hypothetical protein
LTSQPWYARIFGSRRKQRTLHGGHAKSCMEVREHASEFMDADAPQPLAERIKRHLGICDGCDSWMKTLGITVGLLKTMPKEQPPDSLKQKIRAIPRQ